MVGTSPDPCPLSGAVTLTPKGAIGRGNAADPDTVAGGEVGCLAEDGGGHVGLLFALEF